MTGFQISPYACTLLAAFLISFIIVFVLLWKRGIPKRYIGYSMFLNMILIIYGAKMYSVITSGFKISLWNAGISSLGGAIGLLSGVFIFGCIYKEGRSALLEVYSLVLPLMYGVAKVGCYLAGCCHGIPYTGIFAVTYNNANVQGGPYFPVQFLESIMFVCLFLVCFYIYFRKRTGHIVSIIMILCAAAKFSLEYLREEHIGKIITPNQWVCMGFVLVGLVLIYRNNLYSRQRRT